MNLSEHFTLAEMTKTSKPYPNVPPGPVIANLTKVCHQMEHVRDLLGGNSITVNSGYRSPLVNAAVGSKSTSAHLVGHAIDFICPGFGTPYEIAREIEKSGIKFDQLIYEQSWVHLSFAPTMRNHKLTFQRGKYTNGINR